ncbi:MAG TPA: NAD-dependent epimerase/dehydratase family protein [Anditalea sp.]|nr:NAD-dependent epimerase/dehydratase family protein [Anditalea sp.]
MQTILGSGGAIGIELAKSLINYTTDIRLVSRNPKKVNETDELLTADLLNPDELENAIKGSDIVYVTIGFPYRYKIWKKEWPSFIKSLLTICEAEGCKLVFFDNVYMYDKGHLNPMKENTPINPPSKKGEVRAEIAQMIMDRVKSGKLKALIARSADYYGPSIEKTSILTETVFKPLSKGNTANWLANDTFRHSFTFTPDAGRATALLGNTDKAYGQIWHLPTASNPMTGKEWVQIIAKIMGANPKYRVASQFMVRLIGLFVPEMKESVEMLYQYDRHYVFDSSKFEKEFNFKPTSYEEGINEIIKTDYKKTIAKNS